MVSKSFLNPLSEGGKEIVRESGSLDKIQEDNKDLIQIVERYGGQLDDISSIPTNLAELAIKRFEFYLDWKYNRKNFNKSQYNYLFNKEILEFDVLSFYILAQSITLQFGPDSREANELIESQGELIKSRLFGLKGQEKQDLIQDTISDFKDVRWTKLVDLFNSKELKLNKLILHDGRLILSKNEFINIFEDKLKNKNPSRFYDLLITEEITNLIISTEIMQETKSYIEKVHKNASIIEPHPVLVEISNKISKIYKEKTSHFGGGISTKASSLEIEAFPPCIKQTFEGVVSGNRNDAIVLLLTSFLSYARLYPSIFKDKTFLKLSDRDPDLKITIEQILPLIYDAANRCKPPLFDDDPQEKLNITAKLGFGVYEVPELKHEGESKWYTPMSCDKIKIHLSSLCRPDEICKKMQNPNPLTYYNRKKWAIKGTKDDKSKKQK